MWSDHEVAVRLEMTEARAHLDMINSAPVDTRDEDGFESKLFASAVAIRARSVTKSLNFNRVIGIGILETATADQLDEIAAYYGEIGVAFGIELSPASQPEELSEWLRARRWRRSFFSAMLYRSTELPRLSHESWAKSTGLRVERVGPEYGEALGRISIENFGMPASVGRLIAALTEAPAWRAWLAFDGDEVVGGSLSYVNEDECWLGWTSVLPSHRGRWVHAGILSRQIEDAKASGCCWVSCETASGTKKSPNPEHFVLTKFGFREAYMRPTYMARAGGG